MENDRIFAGAVSGLLESLKASTETVSVNRARVLTGNAQYEPRISLANAVTGLDYYYFRQGLGLKDRFIPHLPTAARRSPAVGGAFSTGAFFA